MSDREPKPNFSIIKNRGQPNKATFEGYPVVRQEKIYVEGFGLVPCVPYDDHFVFEIPMALSKQVGLWSHWCTCGSMAGVVWTKDVDQKMLACIFYHQRLYEDGHGYHQTSVINKDDFEEIAGQTIVLPKGRRWLI